MRPRELMAGSLLIASVLLSPPSWPPWSGCDDQRCSSEILADFGAARAVCALCRSDKRRAGRVGAFGRADRGDRGCLTP